MQNVTPSTSVIVPSAARECGLPLYAQPSVTLPGPSYVNVPGVIIAGCELLDGSGAAARRSSLARAPRRGALPPLAGRQPPRPGPTGHLAYSCTRLQLDQAGGTIVMPLAARAVAAVVGGLVVLVTAGSVIGTLIVPRPSGSRDYQYGRRSRELDIPASRQPDPGLRPTRQGAGRSGGRDPALPAGRLAGVLFRRVRAVAVAVRLRRDYHRIHRGGAGPVADRQRCRQGRPGANDHRLASLTGIVTVTLQIAYLPTLYSEFNRRETDIALLNARAGVPSWGRNCWPGPITRWARGFDSRTLPDLYAGWERWAADVAESHTTYLPLVRFRSPRPLSSWVTALLAVLDFRCPDPLAVPRQMRPRCPPGSACAAASCASGTSRGPWAVDVPDKPDASLGISVSYQEFLDAVGRLREVDFPIERTPAKAVAGFCGLAGQLRAGRLRARLRHRRRPCALVRPPPTYDEGHPAGFRPPK